MRPPIYFDVYTLGSPSADRFDILIGETWKGYPYNYEGSVGASQEAILVLATTGGNTTFLFHFFFCIYEIKIK